MIIVKEGGGIEVVKICFVVMGFVFVVGIIDGFGVFDFE